MASLKDPSTLPDENKMARHLAARTIFALRANFAVEKVSVSSMSEADSSIVCDWKASRDAYHNDVSLLGRAFGFVYIGTILDQSMTGVFPEDLVKEIKTDQAQSQEIRECAVEWGIAASVMDTNPFAHVGYKVASQIARLDQSLIDGLARELSQAGTLDKAFLDEWFSTNSDPRSLKELEDSGRF